MYKGQLTGFPTEVVEKMLHYQVEQGNKRDVTVFESNVQAGESRNGFSWLQTSERYRFWASVIDEKNFDIFFGRYPKQLKTNQMNVKQIIKDNNIKEVYSALHGKLISIDKDFFNDDIYEDGSLRISGECLIFPSKEERNWDRFKPKEPVYKPCESVEQFADLFLGAKVKHKTQNRVDIIMHVSEMSMSVLFNSYTLLDGTPLGIKC